VLQLKFETRLAQQRAALSTREKQVCVLLLSGMTSASIAMELNLNRNTVQTYIKRAGLKLGLSGRRGLTQWMLCSEVEAVPTPKTACT
jgi:DNA-binding CsgD family transcriptional regulator